MDEQDDDLGKTMEGMKRSEYTLTTLIMSHCLQLVIG